jgi:hypothetical protein
VAADHGKSRLQRANVWLAAAGIAFFFVIGADLIIRAAGPHPPGWLVLVALVTVMFLAHRVMDERGSD